METGKKNEQIVSVLDWLLNKPVNVAFPAEKNFSPKELIVYKDHEKKEYLGEYLGYLAKAEKKGTYVRTLAGRELERHEKNMEKAQTLFEMFKEDFGKEFPKAKPLTARINLYGSQIYFYFFAEQRFDFAEFVRNFRQKIDLKFFIYQVGSRDRIRLHPNLEEWYDSNGLPLMYHVFKHPLDQVNTDVIGQQGLRGRDMERLKDRSGKLDHTLGFESYIYDEEIPKYPEKYSHVILDGKKMLCTGFNILTQQINLRGEDTEKKGSFTGEYVTIHYDEYEKIKKHQPVKSSSPESKKPAKTIRKSFKKEHPPRTKRTKASKKHKEKPVVNAGQK